jgi:hypothetical protein
MYNQSNAIILVKSGRSSLFFFVFFSTKLYLCYLKNHNLLKTGQHLTFGSSSNSILKIKSINIWLGYTYNSKEISLEPPIQRDLITTPEHAKSQEPANSDKTRDW